MNPAMRPALAGGAVLIALATPVVMRWEGIEFTPYPDLGGVWTSCVGHTGPDVIPGRTYTKAECTTILRADLEKHAALIRPCVPASVPLETQAALLSFAFNAGPAAVCNSTLGRKLKAGDYRGACDQLLRWVNVKGKRVQGLVNRRNDERALCLSGLAPTAKS